MDGRRFQHIEPTAKHGASKSRIWRKIHITVDEQTLEIGAYNPIGDAPVLPDLLNQIAPKDESIRVTADGAYDTRTCHNAIAARGAVAIIPPRKNARLWKRTTERAKARNDALISSKHLRRAPWHKWSGYRRRSGVQAKMNGIKQLGRWPMSKAFDRQVA